MTSTLPAAYILHVLLLLGSVWQIGSSTLPQPKGMWSFTEYDRNLEVSGGNMHLTEMENITYLPGPWDDVRVASFNGNSFAKATHNGRLEARKDLSIFTYAYFDELVPSLFVLFGTDHAQMRITVGADVRLSMGKKLTAGLNLGFSWVLDVDVHQWYFLGYTYNATKNRIEMFKNDIRTIGFNYPGQTADYPLANDITFGAGNPVTSDRLKGRMACLRIYDTALTQDQVLQLYEETRVQCESPYGIPANTNEEISMSYSENSATALYRDECRLYKQLVVDSPRICAMECLSSAPCIAFEAEKVTSGSRNCYLRRLKCQSLGIGNPPAGNYTYYENVYP